MLRSEITCHSPWKCLKGRTPLADGKSRHVGFKGVQPLQRVNKSNWLAVLTVMSNILETSQIRDGLGCDDDYSDYVHDIIFTVISWLRIC